MSRTLLTHSFVSLENPLINDGLTLEVMRERTRRCPDLARELEELCQEQAAKESLPPDPQVQTGEEFWAEQRAEEEQGRAKRAQQIRSRETELRENRFSAAGLHELATEFLGVFSDSDPPRRPAAASLITSGATRLPSTPLWRASETLCGAKTFPTLKRRSRCICRGSNHGSLIRCWRACNCSTKRIRHLWTSSTTRPSAGRSRSTTASHWVIRTHVSDVSLGSALRPGTTRRPTISPSLARSLARRIPRVGARRPLPVRGRRHPPRDGAPARPERPGPCHRPR